MRKLVAAALAATTLAGGVAAVATPASAQPYYGHRHLYRHGFYGPRPHFGYGYGYGPVYRPFYRPYHRPYYGRFGYRGYYGRRY